MVDADLIKSIRFTATCRDLTGRVFERLRVVAFSHRDSLKKLVWKCECVCGKIVFAVSGELNRGNQTSCGCLTREKNSRNKTKHGLSRTPEYKIWFAMVSRCENPENKGFPDYGGRGITVCERWCKSFVVFYNDIGPRPSAEHSIDRKDNDKGYCPENCRWATRVEQQRNLSRNLMLTHNGETLCLAAWAERLGVPAAMIHCRLRRGWSIERALGIKKLATWSRQSTRK